MQVFFPYTNDLEKSAISLDDKRLNKQIVEICQVLVIQYNKLCFKDIKIGYMNHPVVIKYDNQYGISMLLDYGLILCNEYKYRFNKIHHSYFTLVGLKLEYQKINYVCDWKNKHNVFIYIKGDKGKDGVISYENVSKLYQNLLLEKWKDETSKWTRRQKPRFYKTSI